MSNIILVINYNYHILLYLYELTIGQGYTKVSLGWSVQLYQNVTLSIHNETLFVLDLVVCLQVSVTCLLARAADKLKH
jgi:hypothetical protein